RWTVEPQRRAAILERHRAQQSGQPQCVVGVIVGEEHLADAEPGGVAHHLPLAALTAVEQHRFTGTLDQHRSDVALDGGDRRTSAQEGEADHFRPCTRRRNSSRVRPSSRKAPRSADVIVLESCFSTPRIIMQKCAASITTPTPRGCSASTSASATWSVIRSCTCSRRAKTSTTRAIFDNPTIRPLGMYATCALP